ncbi:MAG: MBL fold metallo-hydrolase [Gemmatimonadota bacterium]
MTGGAVDVLASGVAANPGPLTLDGTRSYVLGRTKAVLIDPGPPGAEQVRRLVRMAADRTVTTICLTHAHADHAGCAMEAAAALGADVAASAATLKRLGLGGIELTGGEFVEFDDGPGRIRAIATPGHAADHLCFLWTEERILFTGDLVLGEGTTAILHPDGHMGSYLESLEAVLRLAPTRLLPGHGEPVDDPEARIRHILRHRRAREEEIERAIAAGERSVDGIRRRVYGELEAGLEAAAGASVRAHVVHLRERGRETGRIRGLDPDQKEVSR